MTGEFNPYHQWLGLDPQLVRPNYYQLLGFNNFVNDVAVIKAAADRALTLVRSHRPGPFAAYWAQLLDEIETAKRCLTDPNTRASYDQFLSSATVTPQPNTAPQQPYPTTQPGMYPPGQAPAGTPTPIQPVPTHPQTYHQPQVYQQPYPGAYPAGTPGAGYPMAYDPATGQPLGSPTQPIARTPNLHAPQPPAASVPVPTPSPPPASAPPAQQPQHSPASSSVKPRPSPVALEKQPSPLLDKPEAQRMAVSLSERKQRNALGPMIVSGCCLVALLGAIAFLMSPSRNEDVSESKVAHVDPETTPADPEETTDPLEEPIASEIETREDNGGQDPGNVAGGMDEPEDTTATPDTHSDPQPDVPEEFGAVVPVEDEEGATDAGENTTEMEDPIPLDNRPGETTEKDSIERPSPAMDVQDTSQLASDPDTEDPAAQSGDGAPSPDSLGPLLQAVKDDLREKSYDAVDTKLAKAEGLATSEDHKAVVSRLRRLAKYAREFHVAMQRGYEELEANTEIEVGTGDTTNVIYVIEIRDDGVVFRVNGLNKRYNGLGKVPFGLAIAIGSKGIGMDGPRTALRRAAYVATVSDPDDEDVDAKVRDWLQSASKYVDDAKLLLAALDDSYDF